MTTTLVLSPAIFVVNGQTLLEKSWKVTDLSNETNPTPLEEDIEPRIVSQYITDENEIELDNYKQGDNILYIIKSENFRGKDITINLNDKTVDFLYMGKRLKEDTIENYTIQNDIEKIPLQVIPEDYEE